MLKKEFVAQKQQKLSALLQQQGFAFSQVQKMLRKKDVRVDGKATNKDVLLQPSQRVAVFFSQERQQGLQEAGEILSNTKSAQNKNLLWEKMFESDNVLVVYKFDGIESAGENSLESALGAIAVHRLDRNTQGLMVFAKNEKTAEILKKAFKNHQVAKFYVAEVVGKMQVDQTFTAYLLKNAQTATVKIFDKKVDGAAKISTKIKTIKATNQTSLLQVQLVTGKTHQIRAHLAHLGHAIVGDGKYGRNLDNKKFAAKHQKLAAYKLSFQKIGIAELDEKTFKKLPNWLQKVDVDID